MAHPDYDPTSASAGPRWSRIFWFYGLAVGWVAFAALGVHYATVQSTTAARTMTFGSLGLGFLYMPAPLVAALLTERGLDRGRLFRERLQVKPAPRWVRPGLIVPPLMYLVFVGLTYLLGNVLHAPGVDGLATSAEQILANLKAMLGPNALPAATEANLPSVLGLHFGGAVGAVVAGFTFNGLFALGEEYGWRGFLMDELRPLGTFRANVVTGVLWGLFHAPLIAFGFNYGPHPYLGTMALVLLCVPFSFLLWVARERTGSLMAPAVLHGAFNGMAGTLTVVTLGENRLTGMPAGLVAALAMTVCAILMALVWRPGKTVVRPKT